MTDSLKNEEGNKGAHKRTLSNQANPLVSVIITNYNYGRYIREAIRSVLSQTYHNLEVIVVDDGSTDDSREIIRRCQEENPDRLILIFKENGGQASAFNAGFAASSGEVVSFLDSDDYWMPTRLERVVPVIKGGAYSIVQHNMEFTDENSVALGRLYRKGLFTGDARKLLLKYCFLDFFVPTSGISFKRSVLEEIFPVPESWRICADAYLTRAALFYGQLYSFEEPLGYYRVHGKNNWMYTTQQRETNVVPIIVNGINEHLSKKGFKERVDARNNPFYWLKEIKDRPSARDLFLISLRLPGFTFLSLKKKISTLLHFASFLLLTLKRSVWGGKQQANNIRPGSKKEE